MKNISFNNKLVIKENEETIYETNNLQPIYLYPLTLKDYVDNMFNKKPISITVLNYKKKIDLSKKYYDNLKNIELVLEDNLNLNEVMKICKEAYNKNILITLTIKDIQSIPSEYLKEISSKIKYFKIFYNSKKYNLFINKIKCISKYKNKSSLILVKSYLKLYELDKYKTINEDLKSIGVDIHQLSKKLLPVGKENIELDNNVEKTIRDLENTYNDDLFKFISVKNLKQLYYPRFELDERNSRKCYASILKPYFFNGMVIPCKVNEVINNYELWSCSKENGKTCTDCASIYENDILGEIEKYAILKTVTVNLEDR